MARKPNLHAMRASGAITAAVLEKLAAAAVAGTTTGEIDATGEAFIRSRGGIPAFLGYRGFPASICTSVNEQVVHGIPGSYRLKDGDIVSLDVGVKVDGWYTDAALTVAVGEISDEAHRLLTVTREALRIALGHARPGQRTGDLGSAVENYVVEENFNVVRDCVGHGVGAKLHEDPSIPNYGTVGTGTRFSEGMTVAIEPMVVTKDSALEIGTDHWTLSTADKGWAAHFEETVLITDGEPERLTPLPEHLLGVGTPAKLGKVS